MEHIRAEIVIELRWLEWSGCEAPGPGYKHRCPALRRALIDTYEVQDNDIQSAALNKVLYKFFIYGYLHKMADELGATAKDVDKVKMEKEDGNAQEI